MRNERTDLLVRAADLASVLEVEINLNYKAGCSQIMKAIDFLPQAVALYSSRLERLRVVCKYHYLLSSATALAIGADELAIQVLKMI